MASISASVELYDRMSAPLMSIMNAMNMTISSMRDMQSTMGTDMDTSSLDAATQAANQALQAQEALNQAVDNMDVSAANAAYNQLSSTVASTERYIRDNADAQGNLNQQIQAGVNTSNELVDTVKRLALAYLSMQSVQKVLDVSDELAMTTARLNTMNQAFNEINGTATETDTIVKQIYASAQNARGSFGDMAAVVAKFGNNARDAFASQDEVIAFANLIQKQMTIAGASTQEASNAMLQLSQALGSGVLRGDELNSIFEQAPNLIQSIADYLDVPIGKIREMAQDGQLTADTVKAAIFSSAEDINAKFEAMPMTWGQVWTSFQNSALMAFQPVLDKVNDFANSEAFNAFIMSAQEAMLVLAGIVTSIFDMIGAIGTFAYENWSIISPIIWGIIGALAIYAAYLAITKAAELASAAGKIILCVASYAHAAATGAEASATAAATAAQYGFNAALLACPITWIIILIIALIALFYAAVAAVNKFAGTSVSATGIICGVFMVAAAFIGNLFVALINFVIDIFVVLWNFIAAFANFFGNVFNDPVGAIARLFFDLVDTVLSLLQSLASAIDTIFGSNLAGAVQGWRDSLGGWVDSTFGQGEEIMAKLNAEDLHLDRFEYSSAWDAGYSFGEGIDESIANFDPSSLFDTNVPGAGDYADLSGYGSDLGGLGGIGSGVDDIAGNTGAIADSMDITEEDLKYLRDIAEQEAVNRFTTAEISVDMSGMQNNISNGMDLDGVISGLTEGVNEAIDSMAEGVHD